MRKERDFLSLAINRAEYVPALDLGALDTGMDKRSGNLFLSLSRHPWARRLVIAGFENSCHRACSFKCSAHVSYHAALSLCPRMLGQLRGRHLEIHFVPVSLLLSLAGTELGIGEVWGKKLDV